MLSAKPPPCRIPKGTLGIGSPPSPRTARARRPGSLKITSSCASTGCGAVTLTASRRPRRHATARCVAVIAPACRHPSRQPSAPPFEKYGVERPRRGQTEAAAEFMSRRTRRKPAGALRIPARRQFTFPVKPDAPRPNQTLIQAHNLSGCLCTSLHRIRGEFGLHKVCTSGFLAHDLHAVFFPRLPKNAQIMLEMIGDACYCVGNENTKRGNHGKW